MSSGESCQRELLAGIGGFSVNPIGIGTIWFGRQWPPYNASHTPATAPEIHEHLEQALGATGAICIDTAAGYGDSEHRLGEWLRSQPHSRHRILLATKFGEQFDGVTTEVDLTAAGAKAQFERSVELMGKVDLLYSHITSQVTDDQAATVLADQLLTDYLVSLKQAGDVELLGTSISHSDALQRAMDAGHLDHLDVIQIPAPMVFEHPHIVDSLARMGKAVVVNSPVRKIQAGVSPEAQFAQLLGRQGVTMVLTGTRHHLMSTLGYAGMSAPNSGCTAVARIKRSVALSAAEAVASGCDHQEARGYIRSYLQSCAAESATRLYDCCQVYRHPDSQGEVLLTSGDGAAHGACDYERPVTHAVDLSNDGDGANTLPGITCFQQHSRRVRDVASEDISEVAKEVVAFMQAAVEGGGVVLVNCNFGVSRSSTVVLAFLMSQSMSLQEAWEQLVQTRPVRSVHAPMSLLCF